MPRRKILFLEQKIYHIYNRSTERISLFRSISDYHFFMTRMMQFSEELKIKLPAWALMPTHYHLLFQQKGKTTASAFIQKLCSSYSHYFNKKYSRTGHLFEKVFCAKEITDEKYLEKAIQYIRNNAIHHEIVENITDWPYSSTHWNEIDLKSLKMKKDSGELEEMQ